jgi:hypothetical protein
MFNITNLTDSTGNYTQQLNSSLVDPENIPNFDKNETIGNVTSDLDEVNLNPPKLDGAGMDAN